MNTTSKKALLLANLVLWTLLGCVQGPWEFWPDDPPTYRGIWSYAHVVASRPITDVCFDPIIPLQDTRTQDFAFYDSAHVQIDGAFNGSSQSLVLTPQSRNPNCFDGPADQVAQAGETYQFLAVFRWDSAGQTTTSTYRAHGTIPQRLHVSQAYTNLAARPNVAFSLPEARDLFTSLFPDQDFDSLAADPAARDTFWGANQLLINVPTQDMRIPLANHDTIYNLNPPLDLLSHPYAMDYSDDVRGVLITNYFDSLGGIAANSFDYILGFEPDSVNKWGPGNRHRLLAMQSMESPNGDGNVLDTMFISNAWHNIGFNKFYFYGGEKIVVDYVANSIQGAQDSRIHPLTNIENGQGIFATLIVDSFFVELKPLPNTVVFPLARTRVLRCRYQEASTDDDWENETFCRSFLPSFCADSLSAAPDCRKLAIATAIDSALPWDALMLPLQEEETAELIDTARAKGERIWCMRNEFPTDVELCQPHRTECLVDANSNQCKKELWHYCQDLGWPIDSSLTCGNAMVSWMRLNNVKSSVLTRERNNWCAAHSSDTQCSID